MARAICCDRCGVFAKAVCGPVQLPRGDRWRTLDAGSPSVDDPCGDRGAGALLLCPACDREFEVFMHQRDK